MDEPNTVLTTDGWGAHRDSQTAGGRWCEDEKDEHINALELKAIYFSLKGLVHIPPAHVRVYGLC